MARLLFHSDEISERGTTTSIVGYMEALIKEGHEITWAVQSSNANNQLVMQEYSEKFDILIYDQFERFSHTAKKHYDWAYFMKKGLNDGRFFSTIPTNIHSVFKYYQPHGDTYAYISQWLARSSSRLAIPLLPAKLKNRIPNPFLNLEWVPYGVDLAQSTESLRSAWGIPVEARLILRYGGKSTFDIPWVLDEISWQLDNDKNTFFVGVNTDQFIDHPRALFLPAIISTTEKANMLASADLVLHARRQGESFGMVILEAMQAGKPILAWRGGWDRNHTQLLPDECLYRNQHDLRRKLSTEQNSKTVAENFLHSNLFRISSVMPQFKEVFGNGVL
jgi:glycosyltransferase involved in cell wall biosynthesis